MRKKATDDPNSWETFYTTLGKQAYVIFTGFPPLNEVDPKTRESFQWFIRQLPRSCIAISMYNITHRGAQITGGEDPQQQPPTASTENRINFTTGLECVVHIATVIQTILLYENRNLDQKYKQTIPSALASNIVKQH